MGHVKKMEPESCPVTELPEKRQFEQIEIKKTKENTFTERVCSGLWGGGCLVPTNSLYHIFLLSNTGGRRSHEKELVRQVKGSLME